MIDYPQAIWLALLQGLTEFLPISSSGHLILVPVMFGWPDQGQAFDVAVHVGSLFAALVYFRRDVATMLQGAPDLLLLRYSGRGRLLGNVYVVLGIAAVAVEATGPQGFTFLLLVAVIYPLLTLILINTTFRDDFTR